MSADSCCSFTETCSSDMNPSWSNSTVYFFPTSISGGTCIVLLQCVCVCVCASSNMAETWDPLWYNSRTTSELQPSSTVAVNLMETLQRWRSAATQAQMSQRVCRPAPLTARTSTVPRCSHDVILLLLLLHVLDKQPSHWSNLRLWYETLSVRVFSCLFISF